MPAVCSRDAFWIASLPRSERLHRRQWRPTHEFRTPVSNPRIRVANMIQPSMKVRVAKKTLEATDICSFELADPAGGELPAFTAGSHIDVHVGDALVRQYSICNQPGDLSCYRIAVKNEPQSRGGSRSMHEQV